MSVFYGGDAEPRKTNLVPSTGLKNVCWFWFGAYGEPMVGCKPRVSSLWESAKL
jgi:hypothetical protein